MKHFILWHLARSGLTGRMNKNIYFTKRSKVEWLCILHSFCFEDRVWSIIDQIYGRVTVQAFVNYFIGNCCPEVEVLTIFYFATKICKICVHRTISLISKIFTSRKEELKSLRNSDVVN